MEDSMSFRTVRNLILISFVAVIGSGCSVLLVNGPPSDHQNLQSFGCTQSNLVPAIDGALAGVGGILEVSAVAGGNSTESEAVSQGIATIVGEILFVVNGISATTGLRKVGACRTAQAELDRWTAEPARSRQEATLAQLMTRSDPISAGGTSNGTSTRTLDLGQPQRQALSA